jgi:GT2 family glycosyltransferase
MKTHIIILTKNNIEILFQCLDSIYNVTVFKDYYVWVADTGSDYNLKEKIHEKIDELNLKSDQGTSYQDKRDNTFNLLEYSYYHFSKNNNEVVRYLENNKIIAEDDLLLLCNNDVKLRDDCISGCIESYNYLIANNINVGTLGIRLHFPDNTIQHCGLDIIHRNNCIQISHKNYRHSKNYITNMNECIGVTGAFLLTPYRVFCQCGKLNEKYIEGSQDIEYNLECIRHGYKNFMLGQYSAYHYESLTRNENKDKRLNELLDFKARLFPYIEKHYSLFEKYFTFID